MGELIEKTVLPAYSKIVDAYWEAFPGGDHAIVLDHNVPISNAVYKLNDEYSIKAYRRMSYVTDMISEHSETLEAVINEYKNINSEHPTIPYLNQALSLQDKTVQFIDDAEAVMLDAANIK